MGGIFSTRRSLIFTEEYRDRVLKTDPIAYWVQDEAGGIVSYDMVTQFSGGARNGAYTGPTLGQPGIGDGRTSGLYDGANDYDDIHTASFAAAFNGAEGSLLIWLQVANAGVWTDGTTRYIVRLHVDANNTIAILRGAFNNRLSFIYEAGGVTESHNDDAVKDTSWYNGLMTWSAAADEVRYYLDGAPIATDTVLGIWAGVPVAASTVVGAATTIPTLVFSGYLAHAVSWDRPLSPAEVLSLGVL